MKHNDINMAHEGLAHEGPNSSLLKEVKLQYEVHKIEHNDK